MTHKVGPKGQVVIPKDMRDRLGLRPGDEVNFTMEDGVVLVEPARSDDRPLRGRFSWSDLVGELERDHRLELERDDRRESDR